MSYPIETAVVTNLKNLQNELKLIECGEIERFTKDNEKLYQKYQIHLEPQNNNLILFLFRTYEKEFLPQDILDSMVNGMRSEAYDYLINALNTNENMLIQWTQIEGTTSDYVICYDKIGDGWETFSEIEPLLYTASNKYVEIKNGKAEPIKFL